MEVKILDSARLVDWDRFVESHCEATFFHKAGWKRVIEEALGHPTYFLYAEEAGEIVGILPLAQIDSLLFGNALISTPFCVYGGIVANTASAREVLDRAAVDLARRLGVDHLELRCTAPSGSGRPIKQLYVTFRKELAGDHESNLLAIPRKQRAVVRKSLATGLRSLENADTRCFYGSYAESLRNLGTPVLPESYFQLLRQVFQDDCDIMCVQHGGRCVGGVLSFYFKDTVLPYYGGGTARARELSANDFMYWKVMEKAVERGIRVFDYGRSKIGTGSYRFKLHWGFQPQALPYEYELVNSSQLPEVNPLNPKYRLLIAGWKKLPVALTKLVGPCLARDLG